MTASPHGTDGHGVEVDVPAAEVLRQEPVQAPRRPTRTQPQLQRGLWLADLLTARAQLILTILAGSLLYVLVDIFVQGPLTQLDIAIHSWRGRKALPQLVDAAWLYDKMGQRSVLVPILLVVAGVFARRHRTWRPVVLAMMSFLVLNVVVGAMKVLVGRAETETGSPDVLTGGIIFPSGHSSNMVLSGGLIIYLFWRYGTNPPLRRLTVVIAALTTLTILTSIYLRTHWVTDLIGGVQVGGLLLQLVILFDRATATIRYGPVRLLGRYWSLPARLVQPEGRVAHEPVRPGEHPDRAQSALPTTPAAKE